MALFYSKQLKPKYWKDEGIHNKILVSNTDMKFGSNRDINRDHKKLTQQDVPKKIVIPAAQHDPTHDLKSLSQNRSDLLMREHLYSMSAVIAIMNGETDHATNLPLMNHKGGVPKWGHLSYRLHQTF